jgi:hypothetical protein
MDHIQQDINRVEQRVRRYWVEDGLAEILSGLMIGLVGLYLVVMPPRGPWSAAFALGFPVLIVALGVLSRRWIRTAKDRYVHPRTGLVTFGRRRTHRWRTGLLAGAIAALIALLATRAPFIITWFPALQGLLFAVLFFVGGRKTGVLRFPVEGLLSAIVGLVLSLQHLEENLAGGLLFGWVGLVMALGGALTFRHYLRQSPPPEEA